MEASRDRGPFRMKRLVVFIAQGFGVGRSPVAPGTIGSVLGLAWFAFLISPANSLLFALGLILSFGLSVLVTGRAEQELGQKDPGSIVLDEIVAVPPCFALSIIVAWRQSGHWPDAGFFFRSEKWLTVLGVLAAFRAFDVLKPWPVRQAQNLPGGYGVTADDVLAAVYVNLCVLGVYFIQPNWLL